MILTTKRILFCSLFLLSAFSSNAQLKPEAMMLPLDFSGVKSAEERAILQNHVLTELSTYYDLKSEQEVESARDAAIDKLSSENCTEEACVKIMGDLLDVEHTFTFSVIAAGNYWDLSATRLDYFGTTARRNSACEQCTLPLARKILTELIVGLRPGTAVIKHGEAILTLESEPRALVFWEGIEQGSTPLELTVPTDRPAEILAVAEGYQDFSNFFELKTGEHRKVNIRLVRRRGLVEITTEPSGANIFLDSKPLTASGGQALRTPSTIRPEYGKHTLTLKLEKHQDVQTQLTINRPNLGTQKYTFQPNPGRLIVRVPAKFKNADVFVNGRKVGNMGGKIAKSFEVDANVSLKVRVKRGDFESDVERVKIEPEESGKVRFNEFTDLRIIAIRKKQKKINSDLNSKRQRIIGDGFRIGLYTTGSFYLLGLFFVSPEEQCTKQRPDDEGYGSYDYVDEGCVKDAKKFRSEYYNLAHLLGMGVIAIGVVSAFKEYPISNEISFNYDGDKILLSYEKRF